MSINTIFSFLMPKEDKFFPLINQIGESLKQSAIWQVDFFRGNDTEQREELHRSIKTCETSSDHIIAQIFKELNNSFITPFDREDIHELVESVDDVVLIDVVGHGKMVYVVFAGVVAAGFKAIYASVIGKICLFIILAPVISMVGGLIITVIITHVARKAKPLKAEKWFKRLQLVSSALLSIGHGLNNTQNLMGIMVMAFFI